MEREYWTGPNIDELKENEVFVFGSNQHYINLFIYLAKKRYFSVKLNEFYYEGFI